MLFHDREEIRETLGGVTSCGSASRSPTHLAGKPVSSLEVDGKTAPGISRGGGGFIPTASSTLQAGDYLILMIAKEGLTSSTRCGAEEHHGMKVVVTGGGAVGRHLAQDLTERGHDVTLVEQRRDLAEKLRTGARTRAIVYGDACEPRVLESADVRSADVVVAATGDDEDNLVTSLLAKQEFGVPRVLARVNHPKNEWLFDEQWGVDASVSPPHILTAMVEEAVTVGDLVRLLRLKGGGRARRDAPPGPVAQRRQGPLRAPPPRRYHPGRDPPRGTRDDPSRRPRSRPATRSSRCRASTPRRRSATRWWVMDGPRGAGAPGTAGRVSRTASRRTRAGIDHPDVSPLLAQDPSTTTRLPRDSRRSRAGP